MLSATRPTLKLTSMFVNIFRSDQEYARRESHIEREVYAARLLQLEAKVKSLLQLTMLISSARPGGRVSITVLIVTTRNRACLITFESCKHLHWQWGGRRFCGAPKLSPVPCLLRSNSGKILYFSSIVSRVLRSQLYYAKQSTFPFSGTYFQLPMSEVCPVFAFLSSVGLFSALFLLRTLPSLLP